MEDLHHVTRQYLSCPDPVEAAARKQRVMLSDLNGDMERTAASIIAGEARRLELSLADSNPNTPPPAQNYSFHELIQPGTSSLHSPQVRLEEDIGLDQRNSDVEITPVKATKNPGKLKSIIINSPVEVEETTLPGHTSQVVPEEEETLQEFQNKAKESHKRKQQGRSPRHSPNILSGVSSKKRKLSQIQNSPSRRSGSSKGVSPGGNKQKMKAATNAGPSRNPTNPPIKLIPAVSKKKGDFRVPLPRVP